MSFTARELTAWLRYHDFPAGADASRVAQALAQVQADRPLAPQLAARLSQQPQEQAHLQQLLASHLARHPEAGATAALSQPAPAPTALPPSGGWREPLSRRRFFILLHVLLLGGLGVLGVRGVDCYLQTRDLGQAYRCFIGAPHLERSRVHPGPPSADSLVLMPSELPVPPDSVPPTAAFRQAAPPLARQVPLPPAGPVASDISDLQKSWLDRHRVVIKLLAVVGILTLLFFIEWRRRMRQSWYQQRDQQLRSPQSWWRGALGWQPPLGRPDQLRALSQWLGQRDLFAPPGEAAEAAPPYLLLIEQHGPEDLLAHLYDEIGQELAQTGLPITRYFFENDPRLCWQDQHWAETYLEDLLRQHPQHRVLLISRATRLVDPLSGQLAPWVALLQRPEPVIILTPEAVPAGPWAEAARQAGLLLAPATLDGLERLSTLRPIGGALPPIRWAEADLPPVPAEPTIADLRAYCQAPSAATPAAQEGLFRWLCACALPPDLTWDLVLAIGQRLGQQHQAALTLPPLLIHLLRLPWFRRGCMPPELRKALADQLDDTDSRLARQAIVEVLEASPPPPDSYARDEHQLQLAAQRMALTRRWDRSLRLLGQVREYAMHHSLDDELLRDELSRAPRRFLRMPKGLRQALFHQGIPVLGLRPWARRTLAIGLSLGILWLVKGYEWSNWQRYDQTWYYLADDTARMRFYHYVGVEELKAERYLAARNNLREAAALREQLGQAGFVDPLYHLAYLDWQEARLGNAPTVREAFGQVRDATEVALQDSTLSPQRQAQLAALQTHAQYNLGLLYLSSDQPAQALEVLREAAKQDSSRLLPQTRYAEALALVQNSLRASTRDADEQLLLAADRLSQISRETPQLLSAESALAEALDSLQTRVPDAVRQQRYAELAAVARGRMPDTLALDTSAQDMVPRPPDDLAAQVRLVTPFSDDRAVVTYQGRYGFLTRSGRLLGGGLPFEDARPFAEGLAAVRRNGQWGYVDTLLQTVIDFEYAKALDLRDGWAAVRDQRGRWGIIDRQGRVQLPFRYEKPVEFEPEGQVPAGAEALAVVYVPREPAGKYQYLNKQGEIVFPELRFQAAENFDGPLARVMRYGVAYYLDRAGQCAGPVRSTQRCPTEQWGRELLRVLRDHRAGISAAAFGPRGNLLVTASLDSTLRLWSANGSQAVAVQTLPYSLRALAVSANRVATGGEGGQLVLWDHRGTRLNAREAGASSIWALAYAPDGQELAVGLRDGEILRLDGRTLEPVQRLRTRQGMTVLTVAYAPDGAWLVAGGEDGTLRLWARGATQPRWQRNLGTAVQAVAVSPDGQTIAAGNRDGRVFLYDRASGRQVASLRAHRNWVSTLQFAPDGRYLLSGGYDRQVRVLRLADQVEVLSLRLRTTVTAARFSPDGRYLIVTARGGTGQGLDQALLFELDRY